MQDIAIAMHRFQDFAHNCLVLMVGFGADSMGTHSGAATSQPLKLSGFRKRSLSCTEHHLLPQLNCYFE